MTLSAALDLIVSRTGHQRYRWLCSDDNPNVAQRESFRAWVIQQAEADSIPAHIPIRITYAEDDAPRTRRGCGAC